MGTRRARRRFPGCKPPAQKWLHGAPGPSEVGQGFGGAEQGDRTPGRKLPVQTCGESSPGSRVIPLGSDQARSELCRLKTSPSYDDSY